MKHNETFQDFYRNIDWKLLARQRNLLVEIRQNKQLSIKDRNVIRRIIALITLWGINKDNKKFPIINWKRLKADKLAYLYIQEEESLTPEQRNAMEGILNGIDGFQDAAVNEMGLKETDVFTLTDK